MKHTLVVGTLVLMVVLQRVLSSTELKNGSIMRCVVAVPATQVYSPVPFYSGYEYPAAYYDSRLFEWTAGVAPLAGGPIIEIITAPNNPDGAMRNKTIQSRCLAVTSSVQTPRMCWLLILDIITSTGC